MRYRTLVSLLLLYLVVLAVPVSAQEPRRRDGNLTAGVPAVDFTLQDTSGEKTVRFSELMGKPVVLIFGSSTSPRLVESVPALNKMYAEYKDKAHIYVVYVRESQGRRGEEVPAPETLEERRKVAAEFAEKVELAVPILVDTMDNQVDNAYSGWPDRLYVIDAVGNVFHKSNYTLDGLRPAVSAAPFILYKLTDED